MIQHWFFTALRRVTRPRIYGPPRMSPRTPQNPCSNAGPLPLARRLRRIALIWIITMLIAFVLLMLRPLGDALNALLLLAAWPFWLYVEQPSPILLVAATVGQFVYCAALEWVSRLARR